MLVYVIGMLYMMLYMFVSQRQSILLQAWTLWSPCVLPDIGSIYSPTYSKQTLGITNGVLVVQVDS
jgi:hypothetical protein